VEHVSKRDASGGFVGVPLEASSFVGGLSSVLVPWRYYTGYPCRPAAEIQKALARGRGSLLVAGSVR
jgi:hypothetical protein